MIQAIKDCPVDPSIPEEERDGFYEYFDDDDDFDLYDDQGGFDGD